MQLYYIRHAQSSNNALWVSTGSSQGRSHDPELTDLGRRQAAMLAEFLKSGSHTGGSNRTVNAYTQSSELTTTGPGFGLTHLYSSLMVRAVATGAAVARALGLPLIAWEELHEQGGIYLEDEAGAKNGLPGCNRSYFQEHYPVFVLPPGLDEDGWWRCRPCETFDESRQRAGAFLQALLERHGDSQDRVAVISHGGFFNDVLRVLFDLPPRDGLWFRLYNTAITRIDFDDETVVVTYLNRADHLPVALLT